MAKLLLIDDDSEFSEFLKVALEENGHRVDCLDSAERGPERLAQGAYDAVLLDNKMPGLSGIEFLAALEQREVSVPVILMTGDPTAETAIQAMNLGAFDYVVKPVDIDAMIEELEPLIADAADIVRRSKERVWLPGGPAEGDGPQLIGNSRPMQDVYKLVGKVAGSSAPVLILGETGTGKELIARAIHSHSPRRNRPFVAMNCTALNENLLDDELFGHEPRSFSGAGDKLRKGRFEHANGGTLFLDEVGDMPPMVQAKLLRVLENKEVVRIGGNEALQVDVRIVSATHRDLHSQAADGSFREDLLYRLNGMTIHLPPFRERGPDDLHMLVEHFLKRASEKSGRTTPALQPSAWNRLKDHRWPGNIRELLHVIERAVLVCRGTEITDSDIEFGPSSARGTDSTGQDENRRAAPLARAVREALASGQINLYHTLHEQLESELLRQALVECGGNQVQTAKRLGISRNGLRAKMRAHGLE